MRLSRTAKSCGSGAPTLALSSWVRSTDDGGKRARSPGRARISRKTIVQGMPVDAVYPWLLTPVLFFCTGGHGCNAHPAFPAPSVVRAEAARLNLARNRRRDREVVAADDDNAAGCLTIGWSARTAAAEGKLVIARSVMPGLVPGIHVFGAGRKKDVDGRDKPGHDGGLPRAFD